MFSFFHRSTDPGKNLKKVLKGYELPSFPAVVMEILRKIRDPDSSNASIAKSFALDPGLSVKLLRLANSPAFSPARKIDNISQAIALVGLSQVESLVLAAGIAGNVPRKTCGNHNPGEFWYISACRAMLADEIAKTICPARESECFTAAFLQDMALPFLACNRSEEYTPILEKWDTAGGNLVEIEREKLTWDHAEVASWICDEWELPENIAASIRGHHGEQVPGWDNLPPVQLAAILRRNNNNSGIDEILHLARTEYSIYEETMQDIIEKSFERARSLARLIV